MSMKSCERARLAKSQGLPEANDVRCYHCKRWGYNHGKLMDSQGHSKCAKHGYQTASSQWCKHFNYVGNNKQ